MELNRNISRGLVVPIGFAATLAMAWAGWPDVLAFAGGLAASPVEVRGVCARQSTKLLGRNAVLVGETVKAPKKIRNVSPNYPAWPAGTAGRGTWTGEALIDSKGRVSHVWPIREVEIVPPLPAFNEAIEEAIRHWEFEPLVWNGVSVPVCMTVTVNINWA